MKKSPGRNSLFFLFFLTGFASVSAQSAHREVETLLQSKTVTYGQAVRLVLDASEVLVTSDNQRAFTYAKNQNWLPKNAQINDSARMDALAFLFMKSFGLKGGLFYMITNSFHPLAAHYAFRELVHIKAIQGQTTPNMMVSGDQLLFITSRLLAYRENTSVGN